MKFIKKTGAFVLSVILLLSAGLYPVSVYAETQETVDIDLGSRPFYFEVRRGDCLSTLAERFGLKVSVLAAANNMTKESILVEGRRLMIPEAGVRHYTVKQGDTLWGIAYEYGVSVEALEAANNLTEEGALPVGKELFVPESNSILIEDENTEPEVSDYYLGMPNLTVWPVTGQVSSGFGQRWGRRHEGLDIAAEEWKPIRALEAGTVVFSGRRGTYGKTIIINHGHGLRSLYAHASSLEVSSGEYVEQGQIIARVGNTGKSTGPHLHLEIIYRGTPLNPEKYLPTEDVRI